MFQQIWAQRGQRLYLDVPSIEHDRLENGIYTVRLDDYGRFYLEKFKDSYTFDYKLYDLETAFINRVVKTFKNTSGNLGILLNGIRGTGKTVTGKIIANNLNQPVILVDIPFGGVQNFLNTIPQDITIFVDEYEKVYNSESGKQNEMLTIMDGAMNSSYRRMFILTTNHLRVQENLLQRPSRIRYLKEFKDLKPNVVKEIVNDLLEHVEFEQDILSFVSKLQIITVDIVKEIIKEVNLHKESPESFSDIFNIKKNEGRYQIFEVSSGGISNLVMDNVLLNYTPNYDLHNENNHFYINDNYVGKITRVKGLDRIVVSVWKDSSRNEFKHDIEMIIKPSYSTNAYWSWEEGVDSPNRMKLAEEFAAKIHVPDYHSSDEALVSLEQQKASFFGKSNSSFGESDSIKVERYEESLFDADTSES